MNAARTLALVVLAVAPLAAQAPPAEQQIAAAVLALPMALRADATVLGYGADGKLVPLRKGTGIMICLATDPKAEQFHVSCYHRSMEPFMARGRALRASGVTGAQVDTVRFKEVREGKLVMPKAPATLYQLFGGTFDPVKGEVTGAKALYVVYIPFATAASTGLSDKPSGTLPWIMFPGTPKAHIMFSPTM
jgi:hypothetical protein